MKRSSVQIIFLIQSVAVVITIIASLLPAKTLGDTLYAWGETRDEVAKRNLGFYAFPDQADHNASPQLIASLPEYYAVGGASCWNSIATDGKLTVCGTNFNKLDHNFPDMICLKGVNGSTSKPTISFLGYNHGDANLAHFGALFAPAPQSPE